MMPPFGTPPPGQPPMMGGAPPMPAQQPTSMPNAPQGMGIPGMPPQPGQPMQQAHPLQMILSQLIQNPHFLQLLHTQLSGMMSAGAKPKKKKATPDSGM